MINLSIGSFVLISGGVPTPGFLVQTPIEGLDGPTRRINAYARAGQDGQRVSSHFYDNRIVPLVGRVYSDTSFQEFEDRRKALIAATAIKRDNNNQPLPIRVSFTTMAGQNYYVDVFFDRPVMPLEQPVDSTFLITGTSVDPYIYAASGITTAAISPPSGGGYIVPMIGPYVSAATTGGSAIINNAGSESAWPIITLTGPLTTPVVTNTTTSTYLQLNYTIATGDQVIIDMANHTISLNGGSLIATRTSASNWWSLAPGNNSVTLTTSSTGDTGSMVVAYNTPYIGV